MSAAGDITLSPASSRAFATRPTDVNCEGGAEVNTEVPTLVLGAVAAAFGFVSLGLAAFIGPKRRNRAKLEAYECGIEPTPQLDGPSRFPIKYFLTAMLFIIFDIEIVFLYPYAVANESLGLFGIVEMALFLVTVFVAYAYVWKRGGLDWD